jgi:hypothetical protein
MPIRQAAKAHAKTRTRKPLRFHQREVERAIRAWQAMGLQVGRIEIDPITGKFAIAVAGAPTDIDPKTNPWDKVLPKGSTR